MLTGYQEKNTSFLLVAVTERHSMKNSYSLQLYQKTDSVQVFSCAFEKLFRIAFLQNILHLCFLLLFYWSLLLVCFFFTCRILHVIFYVFPANIYLFKVENKNTRKKSEICSKFTIRKPKRRHWLYYALIQKKKNIKKRLQFCLFCAGYYNYS